MIIEYDRKPPEALAYDEWITSGLIEINILSLKYEVQFETCYIYYIYSDDMSVVAETC